MIPRLFACLGLVAILAACRGPLQAAAADDAIRKAVTLYASFDDGPRADFGGGDLTLWSRFNDPKEKGKFLFDKGYDASVLKVGKGIAGGCLDVLEGQPKGGRLHFPAKGNIAFQKGGWGGSVSSWINTDPNTIIKSPFCDPVQITQKGANNGGIWYDFNDAKPRDLRMGVFPVVPEGQTGVKEENAAAPMVRIKDIGFKAGAWHHIVLTWQNFDTGKKDALATLYVDGKKIGDVKDMAIAMDWDLDKTGIYIALGYIGLMDELAVFNRPLSADEVALLHKTPDLLQPLKKK